MYFKFSEWIKQYFPLERPNKIYFFYVKLIDHIGERQELYWVTWFDTKIKSFKALTWKIFEEWRNKHGFKSTEHFANYSDMTYQKCT